MDKMKLESADITSQNIEKIAELFPNCITETKDKNGNLKKAINFELLKQDLSKDLVNGKECYEFTWVGKKESIIEANRPIRKTLRPCKEESVNWDTTENLYIEGDNLEALKLLQESYLGKVKMIYIDPPYNTGNDFIYPDDYKMTDSEFNKSSDYFDEEGNIKFSRTNSESEGKYHSDWCSMIYSRLMLARNLLSNDGAIFISIDDNELDNLLKISDEVFGSSNFIGCISRATGTTTGQDAQKIGSSLDYCISYAKSKDFILHGLPLDEKDLKRFNESDSNGFYSTLQLRKTGNADRKEDRPNMFYKLTAPDGSDVYPIGPTNYLSRWRVGKDTFESLLKQDMIVWKNNGLNINESIEVEGIKKSNWIPYVKYYLEGRTKQVSNLFQDIEGNKKASIELKELLGNKGIFSNPKPVEFVKILNQISTNINGNDIILDFFSGSSTTAHAVMQLNAEDGGNRKFIMVQLQEPCDEKSEAFKAGYKNICEIGKERIRRAAKKIAEDNPNAKFDGGFRVFKVDDSNMKDVYYAPSEYSQSLLDKLESNIKDDRTDLDLFFGCILDWGLPLNLSYTSETIENCSVHTYSDNALIACFNDNIPESVIKEIAKRKPLRVVFRDSSFADTPSKINVTEIFKLLSPDTRVKVI